MTPQDVVCYWCREAPAKVYYTDDGAVLSICDKCVDDEFHHEWTFPYPTSELSALAANEKTAE